MGAAAAPATKRWADAALAALVAITVGMMIVPLPTPLLDLLIAINVSLGVLLLAVSLYVRDGLSFAAFPTLLLITTLYRLALNVSSTRLILLQADAGQVIDAFGQFVVRGDYAVGAAVFLILTLIQWIVIARGAERVAEVGARFTLDAMPGKQLAIDAEQRAGTMSQQEAREARRTLERESQFYGAMDGAMKFVKGDAVASLAITLVNLCAGVGIGMLSRGLSLQQSLRTYGLLTIGDGLVTMIPALLISTAAGLVVTRVASAWRDGSLGADIAAQLFSDARALSAAAALLLLLALVPGLPWWPFVVSGAGCAALAFRARRGARHDVVEELPTQQPRVADILVRAGAQLTSRLTRNDRPSPAWNRALGKVGTDLEQQLGLRLPALRVQRDETLRDNQYRVHYRELPAATEEATDSEVEARVAASVARAARTHAADALTLDVVQRMLDAQEQQNPALVRHAVPKPVSLPMLADILQRLAAEGVSVRWLDEILEVLTRTTDPGVRAAELTERVRSGLQRRISHSVAPLGTLEVLQLDPDVLEALQDGLVKRDGETWLALPPGLAEDITQATVQAARQHNPRALLTPAPLRRHVRGLLRHDLPDLPVLCPTELTREVDLQKVGTVSA